MFIIFGDKTYTKKLGEYKFSGTCPNCHNTIMLQILKESTWFTLYWIPVIPLKFRWLKACPICGINAEITKEEANNLLEK